VPTYPPCVYSTSRQADQDRGHYRAKNSSISLLVISTALTAMEGVCHRDANRRERKYKRYLVHPDRCPICTQPVGTCQHTNQVGLPVCLWLPGWLAIIG